MTKTIKQWFEETLPKEIAELAIENTIELSGKWRLEFKEPDFKNAVLGAFVWKASKQGHSFWETIFDSNGTIIPELHKTK